MSLDGSLPRDHRRRPPLPSLGFAGGGPLLPGLVIGGIQLGSPLVGTFAQSGERLRVEAPAQSLECPVRSSGRRWPTLGRRPPGQNHGPSSREFELPRPAVPHLQRVDINQAPSREPAEQSKHLVYGHLVRMQDPTRRQALPKAESERRGSSAATSTPEDVRTSTAQKVSWHG